MGTEWIDSTRWKWTKPRTNRMLPTPIIIILGITYSVKGVTIAPHHEGEVPQNMTWYQAAPGDWICVCASSHGVSQPQYHRHCGSCLDPCALHFHVETGFGADLTDTDYVA